MQLEPEPVNITSQIILIVILTLLNAFFASAEMAIVSLNKNKIKILAEEGDKKAIILLKLMEEPTKFLSTIQVGITLAGFFNSASAATGISEDLARYLSGLNVPYSNKIALIIVTIVISYITLVFGELFPKRIALKKSEAIAMFSVRPVLYVSKITAPFIKLLSASTNILVSLAGLDKEGLDEKVSKEEIKSLVEVGQEHGVINETEKEMINSIFEFDDKLADEVMTPRTEVYLINIDKPLEEYLDELLEEKYSRVPVYEEDIDNIIGILYMKDFILEARKHEFENVNIREILHPPYFVPETKNIDDLFNELKSSKKHMAILIDEYGGFSGIVTIEDLVEEVMGNIDDEYDEEECFVQKIDSNTFIVNGLMPIDDLNDYLHIQLVSDECDTISGFLINIMGKIPNNIEEKVIEYENIIFKIESVKEKRIEKIKICIQKDK
ncbi:HlyC/CorC family transporter [Clostridium botulinum]|uniref:HlyC/CorC family transporter n=1 Tax=Clostridium botulinum TaxID=1491 RepID=A0A6B4MJX5_CLOBO|nr:MULTISPECIES: hemolysin family protein [Clostridium]EES47731.1 CBS/transporter domain protein [Clostridium botulinum E1 str. 'BoNT E Beluga']MBN1036885.1 HlyC/CorC family transporter [Clostridium botulinum]MBN1043588.1 HlyC/CorC family transporter [Clostridium botulinum]MBN1066217.1 HlyC/CorC family transporter [Clostridium botulinum]MBY6762669.1 HlyC/CorC family transporter [Clostridium botulinum]